MKRIYLSAIWVVSLLVLSSGVDIRAAAPILPNEPSVIIGGAGKFSNGEKDAHGPVGLAAGDFNGDGLKDIAIANVDEEDDTKNVIYIFYQKKDYSFGGKDNGFPPDFTITGGGKGLARKMKKYTKHTDSYLAAGDIDKDGKDDLVYIGHNPEEKSRVSYQIFYQGENGFSDSPSKIFKVWDSTRSLSIMDVDNNGDLDIVGEDPNYRIAGIFRKITRNGSPAFRFGRSFFGGFVQGNLNKGRDSHLDIARAGAKGYANEDKEGGIKIIFHPVDKDNNRNIGKSEEPDSEIDMVIPTPEEALGEGIEGLQIGDVNGDGRDDLVALSWIGDNEAEIYIYYQKDSHPWFPNTPDEKISGFKWRVREIASGDLDNDGKDDITAISWGKRWGKKCGVFYAKNGFSNRTPANVDRVCESAFDRVVKCMIEDLNGDGLKDLILVGMGNPSGISIFYASKPPVSRITKITQIKGKPSLIVEWEGKNDPIDYTIQYRENNNPWQDWLISVTDKKAIFTNPEIKGNSSYSFRSIARSKIGVMEKQEDIPEEGDISITVTKFKKKP